MCPTGGSEIGDGDEGDPVGALGGRRGPGGLTHGEQGDLLPVGVVVLRGGGRWEGRVIRSERSEGIEP